MHLATKYQTHPTLETNTLMTEHRPLIHPNKLVLNKNKRKNEKQSFQMIYSPKTERKGSSPCHRRDGSPVLRMPKSKKNHKKES